MSSTNTVTMTLSQTLQRMEAAVEQEHENSRQASRHRSRSQAQSDGNDDEDDSVPFPFLWDVFYLSFLQQERNHLGIYKSLEGKKKGNWFGLIDPPIFYMFDEIKIEPFQRLIPTKTTQERWTNFIAFRMITNPDSEEKLNYSFFQLFKTMAENGYMEQVDLTQHSGYIDKSIESATEKFMKRHSKYPEEMINRIMANEGKKTLLVSMFSKAFLEKHALEHVKQAWVLTESFFKTAENMNLVKDPSTFYTFV